MPTVDFHVLEGVFSLEEKQALIRELALAVGRVAGKPVQDNTHVRIYEVKSGHWGNADAAWTTEDGLKLKSSPG